MVVTKKPVGTQIIWAGLLHRAIAVGLRRSAVFCVLLLAFLLSSTVPQGFMRATDGDGMAIVLCTTDGTSEVWLSANGEIQDEAPVQDTASHQSACLAITVVLTTVQDPVGTLWQTIENAAYLTVFLDRNGAVAPVLTPLQPRAPPVTA